MYISKDIKYLGVNDHQVDLFEGQYVVPNGISYNSYAIMDEKKLPTHMAINPIGIVMHRMIIPTIFL